MVLKPCKKMCLALLQQGQMSGTLSWWPNFDCRPSTLYHWLLKHSLSLVYLVVLPKSSVIFFHHCQFLCKNDWMGETLCVSCTVVFTWWHYAKLWSYYSLQKLLRVLFNGLPGLVDSKVMWAYCWCVQKDARYWMCGPLVNNGDVVCSMFVHDPSASVCLCALQCKQKNKQTNWRKHFWLSKLANIRNCYGPFYWNPEIQVHFFYYRGLIL